MVDELICHCKFSCGTDGTLYLVLLFSGCNCMYELWRVSFWFLELGILCICHDLT